VKRLIKYYVLLFCLVSCQSKQNNQSESVVDSSATSKQEAIILNDSMAVPISREILTAVKNKDYSKVASFIEPLKGVRFSPYGYVDTVHDKIFTASEFLNFATNKKATKFTWGTYDGSGDKMILTVDEYFKKFVYDADFLNAPETSLNKTLGKGNSLNNIDSIYKNCVYTEFYFPGFDKKYEGMDWRNLKLAFRKENNKLYLVAIVHDQWTI
jgi:hypothetical protein